MISWQVFLKARYSLLTLVHKGRISVIDFSIDIRDDMYNVFAGKHE